MQTDAFLAGVIQVSSTHMKTADTRVQSHSSLASFVSSWEHSQGNITINDFGITGCVSVPQFDIGMNKHPEDLKKKISDHQK